MTVVKCDKHPASSFCYFLHYWQPCTVLNYCGFSPVNAVVRSNAVSY